MNRRRLSHRQYRRILLLLIILWMGCIYTFSGRDGNRSTEDSTRVGRAVCQLFVPGYRSWSKDRQYALAVKIDHPVRKTAHATEYAVLGMLFFGFFYHEMWEKLYSAKEKDGGFFYLKLLCVKAWVAGTVYAGTDEYHQLFVPGRSGQFSDILIDSSGVLCGVLILLMITLIRKGRRHWKINDTVNQGQKG